MTEDSSTGATVPDPSPAQPETAPLSRPIVAGIVTSLVGVTSSFAVVLTGLDAVGASRAQAASGLLVLCLTMGASAILLAWRYPLPISLAGATPGGAAARTRSASPSP